MASRAGSFDKGFDDEKRPGGNGRNTGEEHVPYFDQLRQGASDLYGKLELERRVGENPIAMLAIAWGIGFVLGGGLSSNLAKRALGLGLKAGVRLLVPMVAEKAWSMTRSVGSRASGSEGR